MNSFWALARNDIGFNIGRITRKHRYFWIYAVAAAMIWLFQYALTLSGSSTFTIDPRFAVFVIVPAFFILSGSVAGREWRDGTAGWWLSLPHSRAKLILAKAAASFVRKLMFLPVFAAVLALLFLGLLIMRPELVTAEVTSAYAVQSLQLLALALVFSPAAVASGILFRIVPRSKWKIATPLVWSGVPTALFYLIVPFVSHGSGSPALMDMICRIWSNGPGWFLLFLLAQCAFAAVMLLLSVYLLARKTEL